MIKDFNLEKKIFFLITSVTKHKFFSQRSNQNTY